MEHRPGRAPGASQLFTIRVWRERLTDGEVEWRGEILHVPSGRRQFFRQWEGVLAFLRATLDDPREGREPVRRGNDGNEAPSDAVGTRRPAEPPSGPPPEAAPTASEEPRDPFAG